MTDWRHKPITDQPIQFRSDQLYAPPSVEQLTEKHHHCYGRPWILGRCIFDTLIKIGVTPKSTVLDFGCGAGRLAIWLIRYLENSRYYGVEAHYESIDALLRYEIPLHHLQDKCAMVSHDSHFQFDIFDVDFDYVVDPYSSIHLSACELEEFITNMAERLKPGGKYVVSPPPSDVKQLAAHRLVLKENMRSECRLIENSGKSIVTEWAIYEKE